MGSMDTVQWEWVLGDTTGTYHRTGTHHIPMEYTVQWVPGVRQWPSHGTTHTGQYPPGKGYSYLRTWVLVLTATLPPGTPPTLHPVLVQVIP